MLAKLTQIDAMIGLVIGGDIHLEKDNLINKDSKFSLIEDNVINRKESMSCDTTDNIAAVDNLRTGKEYNGVKDYVEEGKILNSVNIKNKNNKKLKSGNLIEKDDLKDNRKDAKTFEKSNLIRGLIIGQTKSDVNNERNKNYKHKNNPLIQNIFNKNTNSYQVEKEPIKVSLYGIKNGEKKYIKKEVVGNIYTMKPNKKDLPILQKIYENMKNKTDGNINVTKLIRNIKRNDKDQESKVIIKEKDIFVTKENVEEKEIKVNINELNSDKNETNINSNQNRTTIIKQVYDETKKLTSIYAKASKVIQNNTDKLNNSKNNNNKIISDLKDVNNKSTNTVKSKTIESFSNKLNITNIKESTEKIKVIKDPDFKTPKINQIINNNGNQPDIISKTRIEGNQENTNIAGRNIKSDISTDINKQILESIHSSISRQGIDKQITIQLNPPELGKVLIKFQEQDTQITGLLEVSKPQTRLEVEQALPQLIRSLNDNGIQIRKLEVVSTDVNQSQQESQESFKEQLFSGDDTAHSNSTANDARKGGSGNSGFYDWLSNKSGVRDGSGLENIFVGNESINILI